MCANKTSNRNITIEGMNVPMPEAQDLITSIRKGEIDALVVTEADGIEKIFTLEGADRPYRLMIESMTESAVTFDESGTLLFCNKSFELLSGLSNSEVLCSNVKRFFRAEDSRKFQELLDKSKQEKGVTELELLREGQNPVPVQLSISSVYDGNDLLGYCAVITDMTGHYLRQELLAEQNVERVRREEAEKGRKRITGYLESITDCFFSLDRDFRFTAVNDKALTLFLRNREDLLGHEIWDLFPALSESDVGKCLREAAASESALHFESPWELGYGGWVEVHGYPAEEGLSVYARDITKRKRAEKEREKLVQELNESSRRKDLFLAMLAHELRSPMHPIRNAVEILRKLDAPNDTAQWARDVIDNQVDHLSRLVDDLLDVSRITLGKVTLQKAVLDLARVLKHAVETSKPYLQEHGHSLKTDIQSDAIYVEADATRLSQVVSNLLNNAAKFTPHGGSIVLSAKRDGNTAVVSVRDDGIGIPEDMQPQIFDVFIQANDSLDRKEGGLGLGLTLVKSLVEMHGGAVSVYSDGHGNGSEFTIRLPIASPKESQDAKELIDTAGNGYTYRILVVDDSLLSAVSMAELLRLEGHTVETAASASTALTLCRSFKPEVILLDIGLPEMDGYKVAEHIRKDFGMTDTTIIALTGYGRPEDQARAKLSGFDHHMTKPVHTKILHSTITALRSKANH